MVGWEVQLGGRGIAVATEGALRYLGFGGVVVGDTGTAAARLVVWRVCVGKIAGTSKSIESFRPCEAPWYL
jgi:hypothetical protein